MSDTIFGPGNGSPTATNVVRVGVGVKRLKVCIAGSQSLPATGLLLLSYFQSTYVLKVKLLSFSTNSN